MGKTAIAIIIILVIGIASLIYYISVLPPATQKAPGTVEKVINKESAQKASSDIKSNIGDIQKELADIQNVLPG